MTTDSIALALAYIVVFPGFMFLAVYGLLLRWFAGKTAAALRNRTGPPWYQSIADILMLLSKETDAPGARETALSRLLPYSALAAVIVAVLPLPVWTGALRPFQGDLPAVVYLLTVPAGAFLLAGWNSASPSAPAGAARFLTRLFACEATMMLSLLGPAALAGTWSVTGIADFFTAHRIYIPAQIPGLFAALLALQGKLELLPYDVPHDFPRAGNRTPGALFAGYSGRDLAFFYLAAAMELAVGAALINAVFLGGPLGLSGTAGLLFFLAKTLAIIFLLAALECAAPRLRMERTVEFYRGILAPLALAQILFDVFLKFRMG